MRNRLQLPNIHSQEPYQRFDHQLPLVNAQFLRVNRHSTMGAAHMVHIGSIWKIRPDAHCLEAQCTHPSVPCHTCAPWLSLLFCSASFILAMQMATYLCTYHWASVWFDVIWFPDRESQYSTSLLVSLDWIMRRPCKSKGLSSGKLQSICSTVPEWPMHQTINWYPFFTLYRYILRSFDPKASTCGPPGGLYFSSPMHSLERCIWTSGCWDSPSKIAILPFFPAVAKWSPFPPLGSQPIISHWQELAMKTKDCSDILGF